MKTKSDNICKGEAHKTKLYEKSAKFNCIRVWNDLPFRVRNLQDDTAFITRLCNYILDKRDDISC